MTAVYKNITPSARLAKGDVVRVSFAQEHAYLALDASFANDFGAIWSRLFELNVPNLGNPAFPIGKNSVTKGMTTTVADLRVTRPVAASDLVTAMDVVSGFYVTVSGIEKLSAADAAGAASTRGAVQREVVRVETQAEQSQASWWNQLASATGFTLGALKWAAIGLVVVVFLMYGPQLLKETRLIARK